MALKAIPDKQLADFVTLKMQSIGENMIRVGTAVQQAVDGMERVVADQEELKRALREGIFQLDLR